MRQGLRIVATVMVILFLTGPGTVLSTEKFQSGVSYYFENFDPAMKPWDPGQDLNFEEVFKNYIFYEIVFDPSGQKITVNRYLQNRKDRSELFLLRSDRSLVPQ